MKVKIASLIVALLVAGGGVFVVTNDDAKPAQNNTTQTQVVEQETAEESAIEISEDGTTIAYSGVEGETALATMQALTEVATQSSDFGEFVTAINGLEADSSSEYWAFYVNGELASVGAGSYVAEDGDQIEWNLENF